MWRNCQAAVKRGFRRRVDRQALRGPSERTRQTLAADLQIGRRGFAAAAILFEIEVHRLAFIQTRQTRLLDSRDVDEDILAATLGFDEAEALGGVEPLYDARAGPGGLAALAFAAAKSAATAPIATAEAAAITPAAAAKAAPVAATAVTTAVTATASVSATAVTASVSAAAVATAITAAAAKAATARTSGWGGALRGHNDLRRRQLARTSILFELVVDLVALIEAVEAGLIEGRDVNEDIRSAIVRLNEAKTLSRVEPLDCTARHIVAIHRDREVSAGHMPAPG